MNRSIADIRENLDYVGCDNATALELTMEIERQAAELENLKADHDRLLALFNERAETIAQLMRMP